MITNYTALPLCPLVEQGDPLCYSRNIELGGQLIFEPATLVVNLVALIMTAIMIYYVKQKYTAVGRKEIVIFFYLYAFSQLLFFLLVSGFVPTATEAYKYLTAIHGATVMATLWSLLMNGFVGFQWTEDGTALSLWVFPFLFLSILFSLFLFTILSLLFSLYLYLSFSASYYSLYSLSFLLFYLYYSLQLFTTLIYSP